MAISPWGDLLIHDLGKLELRAGHDGTVLETVRICSTTGATFLSFVDAQKALLVCGQSIIEIRFPGTIVRTAHDIADAHKYEDRIEQVAIVTSAVAVGDRKGRARVLDPKDWSTVLDVNLGAEIESLALSKDGQRLAIASRNKELLVYDLATKAQLFKKTGKRFEALSFSLNGDELFGSAGSDSAQVFDGATGRVLRSHPLGDSLDTSRFVAAGRFAAASSDKVLLVGNQGREPEVLPFGDFGRINSWDVISSWGDGALICAGGWKAVACVRNVPLKPSSYVPAPALVGADWATVPVSDRSPPQPLRRAWLTKEDKDLSEWNHNVAVAPWGDVVAIQSYALRLYARHDGSVLSETKTCFSTKGAMEFVDHDTVAFACNYAIVQARLGRTGSKPSIRIVEEHQVDMSVAAAAIRAGAIAIGGEKGKIQVLARGTWTPRFETTRSSEIKALALSADESLLAVTTSKAFEVIDLTTRKVLWSKTSPLKATGFAPDGKELFTFGTNAWALDARTGRRLREYPASGWLTTIRYVGDGKLSASAGATGLFVYRRNGGQHAKLPMGSGSVVALGASADGSIICAGTSSGHLGCYSTWPAMDATAQPPSTGVCSASAECIMTGRCSRNAEGRCAATKDSDCAASMLCKQMQQCSAKGGACVASAAACKQSPLCNVAGLCNEHDGRCSVTDDLCRSRKACREKGRCSARGAQCGPGTHHDCWQSEPCIAKGLCTLVGDRCAAVLDSDCRQSWGCKGGGPQDASGGRCSAKFGNCDIASSYGCQRSNMCRWNGRCEYRQGKGCVPTKRKHCLQSSKCKRRRHCRLQGDRCVR